MLAGLGCALLVSNLISSRLKLRDANRHLDQLARVDALTGLYNRRQAQDCLNEAVATAELHSQPLAVLMVDLDRFKQINDTHGHDIGDAALRLVADTVRTSLRAGDIVGRWGGEEFLAILPMTDRSTATRVAERVRQVVASTQFVVGDRLIPLSVSIGAAARSEHPSDALVAAADTAMYAAKTSGRDNVKIAD